MGNQSQSVPIPKLTALETFRGFQICASCGVKYQWSPNGDCPNHCQSKANAADDEQEKLIASQAEHLVLLKKLEAIGFSGAELEAKARDIRAQIIAASFLPRPIIPAAATVTAGTIAKGVLLANLVITVIVFVLLLITRALG